MSEIDELRESLAGARQKLVEQNEFIQKITKAPWMVATLVHVGDETCLVHVNGSLMEILLPDFPVSAGDQVRLLPETLQIIDRTESVPFGILSTCLSVISPTTVEVEIEGKNQIVESSRVEDIKEGDRVLVDVGGFVVLDVLKNESTQFSVRQETGVEWDDVGGLTKAKKALQEAVELPFKFPHLYAGYGKKQVKGVLLHGPPGCGKTMLAKACATSLASLHGEFHSSGFIYVKGPEILSKWVGQSESTIRSLFHRAREHKETHGYPAILFIDEADALFGKRGSSHSSFVERTIVPQFLSEMDGFDESAAVVLLSTNRPDTLDPAVVRDGRIDRKVFVPRPCETAAREIFQLHLQGKALSEDLTLPEAAEIGVSALYDPEQALYRVQTSETEHLFSLRSIVNGAMIAGIVDQACAIALYRDLDHERTAPTGITEADIREAIGEVLQQNLGMNHDDELREFIAPLNGDLKAVQAITATA